MTIIGIFTWIVVYSFWTIQLFSIIEDLWSAIMFSWVFLAGIMFIMSTIFFDPNKGILKDKGSKIFILGLVVVVLSLIWKGVFSSSIINVNKWNNVYEQLNIKIQQAETIKEQIEVMRKEIETERKQTEMKIDIYQNIIEEKWSIDTIGIK
jgi:hypothetical protein